MIFADHSNLQILARAEMREHAAFAHLHAVSQQTNGQALQAIAACQVERGVEDGRPSLFTFAHKADLCAIFERSFYFGSKCREQQAA